MNCHNIQQDDGDIIGEIITTVATVLMTVTMTVIYEKTT